MIVLWFVLGGLAEWGNMLVRRWTVSRIHRLKAGHAVWLVVGGFVLRLLWMALIIGVAVACNPAYGLATFAGYWLSRWISIRFILTRPNRN